MGPAAACIGIHLPDIAPACGCAAAEEAAHEDEAFKQLQAALHHRPQGDALPWKELYAAVSASVAKPWPSNKLLHEVVTLLSRAATGAGSMLQHMHISWHLRQNLSLLPCCPADACSHLQRGRPEQQAAGEEHVLDGGDDDRQVSAPSEEAANALKLALTLLCHTLRIAAEGCSTLSPCFQVPATAQMCALCELLCTAAELCQAAPGQDRKACSQPQPVAGLSRSSAPPAAGTEQGRCV